MLFYLAIVYLGVFGLAYSAIAHVVRLALPGARTEAFGQRVLRAAMRHYFRLLARAGLLRLENDLGELRGAAPCVLAANHPSLLDALLAVTELPNVVCIMKTDVTRNPILGGPARLAGYIPAEPTMAMLRAAHAALARGSHLLVFPEGTRTVAPEPVNRFTASAALISRMAGTPIQTILIETETRFTRKGWPVLRRPPLPVIYRLRLGRRFAPSPNARALTHELECYFRDELAQSPAKREARRATAPDLAGA